MPVTSLFDDIATPVIFRQLGQVTDHFGKGAAQQGRPAAGNLGLLFGREDSSAVAPRLVSFAPFCGDPGTAS
jgi:hypothetical protein